MTRLRIFLLFAVATLSNGVHAADALQISRTLDSIELPDLSGELKRIDDWNGKTILLNFWASWCTPCQYEIPHLVNYQKKFADSNFQVVSIGLDDERKLKNVKRSLRINYPVLVISQLQGADLLVKLGDKQQIVPYTLIIDAEGNVVYRHQGEFGDDAFELYVRPLLNLKADD